MQAKIVYSFMLERLAPWLAALLLACAAGLAWSAATTDSVTVDEPSHLVAGYSTLVTGDFRLSPDHPPLARWLLALPLIFQQVHWPVAETPAWQSGDFLTIGREFYETWNDGQRLIRSSRAVAIVLFLALVLTVGAATRELFGGAGALLAMTVVAFDPNWLAHGHLATADVPFALAALLTLLAAQRWLSRPTLPRLALLAAGFSASALVKFSWPTLVPALVAMVLVARPGRGRWATFRTLAIAAGALALVSLLAIWVAYGLRFRATAAGEADFPMMVPGDYGQPPPRTPAESWEVVLHDPSTGSDRPGQSAALLRFAHAHRLLPEPYLFGIAFVQKKALGRAAYLRGEYSNRGFLSYFPWALAIKTPLPALLLFVGGLGALALRWRPGTQGPNPLAVGLGVFAAVYGFTLLRSGLNLGYRHLLPVTAVLAIAAGGLAAARAPLRWRRPLSVAVGLALAWLVAGTLLAAPHWIGYFNEAAGGWRQGHRYLLDSNLDWGQDLLRLRTRLAREPDDLPVWLLQAGHPPLPRGMQVRWLWGEGSHAPHPAAIAGGLYVVSASDLLGLTRPLARAESWRDPRLIARFEQAAATARVSTEVKADAIDDFEALRRLRLLSRLALRPPDERIGTSLFLFRLSDAEVAEWTTP
ncbi:MAG: glycosyltransferase family 39 protein [Thermoanaerobaculia bacterium]|nr:glycosyltransferase family 39 protein [Thermoanaerobaculia bacterium]MBP9823816.1 glycosyltransferase family 39 protein [Thermoanaerobaculia bacterium]